MPLLQWLFPFSISPWSISLDIQHVLTTPGPWSHNMEQPQGAVSRDSDPSCLMGPALSTCSKDSQACFRTSKRLGTRNPKWEEVDPQDSSYYKLRFENGWATGSQEWKPRWKTVRVEATIREVLGQHVRGPPRRWGWAKSRERAGTRATVSSMEVVNTGFHKDLPGQEPWGLIPSRSLPLLRPGHSLFLGVPEAQLHAQMPGSRQAHL